MYIFKYSCEDEDEDEDAAIEESAAPPPIRTAADDNDNDGNDDDDVTVEDSTDFISLYRAYVESDRLTAAEEKEDKFPII